MQPEIRAIEREKLFKAVSSLLDHMSCERLRGHEVMAIAKVLNIPRARKYYEGPRNHLLYVYLTEDPEFFEKFKKFVYDECI